MKSSLSASQIHNYRENGYLYYPNLLSDDEVKELKSAVLNAINKLAQTQPRSRIAGEGAELVDKEDEYYDRVFLQRINLWKINQTVKKYMLSEKIGKMITKLEGTEGFRVWHDQTLIKEAYGNPTGWHLDNPYWSFSSSNSISVWISLGEATLENGCMWFLPGSHKFENDNTGIGKNIGDLIELNPRLKNIDPKPVPMAAGDCSFHNGLVAHGAGANMTRHRRIAMTCAYMPINSTFNGNQNILPTNYFNNLKKGDLLNDDQLNPIVYKIN